MSKSIQAWEEAYSILCAIQESITYENEEQAKNGKYGLPINICKQIEDFIANDCPPSILDLIESAQQSVQRTFASCAPEVHKKLDNEGDSYCRYCGDSLNR